MSFLARWWPGRQVVTSLIGGLGNQMFQYAAGRALAIRDRARLILDTSPLHEKADHTPRTYGLDAFRIQADVDSLSPAALAGMAVLHEGSVGGRWPRTVGRQTRLVGHWQSEVFFTDIRATLRRDFTLAAAPRAYTSEIAAQIGASQGSVSIHFRRGDYVSNAATARFHGTCPVEYYREALERLRRVHERLELFVFSDDPEWVKADAGLPSGVTLVDSGRSTPAEDIWLMSLCRHHVLANSSFSWWGAWLAMNDGITIAPNRWFLDQSAAQAHIVPQRWERI